MKLGAYKINEIPVSDLDQYDVSELDGNAPYVVANTLAAGYEDISGIENFDRFGFNVLGAAYGFKDWKCLQREIKTLVMGKVEDDINANWDELNANEKLIACKYILSKIPAAKFGAVITDPDERVKFSIEYDFNNRQARGSWSNVTGRIQIIRVYLFGKIGATNALEVFYDVVKDGLLELYEGGIEGTQEDGNLGINDFLLARSGTFYSSDGLKGRSYPVIDGSGDSLADVANALVNIVSNGIY
ncbi:MAG: hypothetical protein JWP12_1834 [Bacteroidetes bacterium]|nr:hypothetical protein [Bacteroidota bacterium]